MRMMVPTLWVEAMLTRPMKVGDQQFKTGELVKVAYGVALQGLATGTFSCLRNEDAMHAESIERLKKYGPDCWFPAPIQTIGKLWEYLESKRGVSEVPRTDEGETIH